MKETKSHLFDVLEHFDTAMLCTRQPDGTLRARPMAVAEAQRNGDLWFVTSVETGKIDEVLNDSGVVAAFQSKTRYLSISGRAEIVGDETLIARLWQEAWREWFPQGKDDPRLVLIHVRATEAEYWDRSGAKGLRHVFDAAKAALKGERADGRDEEHGRVML